MGYTVSIIFPVERPLSATASAIAEILEGVGLVELGAPSAPSDRL
jgi:hypothetical protein